MTQSRDGVMQSAPLPTRKETGVKNLFLRNEVAYCHAGIVIAGIASGFGKSDWRRASRMSMAGHLRLPVAEAGIR